MLNFFLIFIYKFTNFSYSAVLKNQIYKLWLFILKIYVVKTRKYKKILAKNLITSEETSSNGRKFTRM